MKLGIKRAQRVLDAAHQDRQHFQMVSETPVNELAQLTPVIRAEGREARNSVYCLQYGEWLLVITDRVLYIEVHLVNYSRPAESYTVAI